MCELLSRYLEESGHVVHTAVNGQEAWEALSEEHWPADVVVADILMPMMGGRELLQRMREADLRMPMVLLSGQININQDDAVLAGAVCIIHKPFELDDLDRVLNQL